jgi:uncharacterized membrane protein
MPFNEKGEFIRAAAPATRSEKPTAATGSRAQRRENLSRNDRLTLVKGIAGLLLLAGVIWFVAVFHEWIGIGLGLWLISSLRAWLR